MAWRKSPKRIQKTNFAFFHNFTLVNTTTGPPSIPHPPKKASHFTQPTSSKRPRTSSKATVEVAEWTPKTEGQCNFGQPLGGGKLTEFADEKLMVGLDPQKNAEFPPAHPPGKVSHWNSENSNFFFFSFPFQHPRSCFGSPFMFQILCQGGWGPGNSNWPKLLCVARVIRLLIQVAQNYY